MMTPATELAEPDVATAYQPHWALRGMLLWQHRHLLARVTTVSLLLSLCLAFAIPKLYKAKATIMPPDPPSAGAMMLAALLPHAGSLGGLGSLASSFMGSHSSTALFEDLLRSGTVSGHLIDRFQLQHLYRNRYRVDTAKHLARVTAITEDKKSGVITVEVEDKDPVRARDMVLAYLEELNKLVVQTNNSSAHQERLFIERRLRSATSDLESAQLKLSEFSSKTSTVDIKEQTHAMVDAGARVEGELLVEQSGLQSLRQIYGDGNVRVRETQARIASLQKDLEKLTGSSAPLDPQSAEAGEDQKGELYPPLRQLPRLAVPYADLLRQLRVQEAVYDLLTQQYEMARIEEAKDVPAVTVIDAPGVPEKKSFPPRLLLALALTSISFAATAGMIVARDHWAGVDPDDPGKMLANEVWRVVRRRIYSHAARQTEVTKL
jgi:capsule polysaccharide export protein KpsE/RkpR